MKDDFPARPGTFGGVVLRVDDAGRSAFAVATLVDADTLALQSSHAVRVAAGVPDGVHAAAVAALAGLRATPDIVLVEGHGTADVAGAGLAVRVGAETGLPCIGVDSIVPPELTSRTDLHDVRGAFTALRDGQFQVGWLLRSRVGAEPLVVSPGHKVALPSAPELVMRCVRDHRLPEPLRLALAEMP